MKNKLIKLSLVTILVFTSFFSIVEARNPNTRDVWWYKNVQPGQGTWKAHIIKMNNGMVHEWRYEWNGEPINVHLIYKPVELFPNPPGGKWIRWTFDDRYEDLPGDEADLGDYFTRYNSYWVVFNQEVY